MDAVDTTELAVVLTAWVPVIGVTEAVEVFTDVVVTDATGLLGAFPVTELVGVATLADVIPAVVEDIGVEVFPVTEESTKLIGRLVALVFDAAVVAGVIELAATEDELLPAVVAVVAAVATLLPSFG